LILFPVSVDNIVYNNMREAHRAVFMPQNISYYRFARRLKKGNGEFCGHSIKKIARRYDIGPPADLSDDGADLVPLPVTASVKREHRRGEPLLCYPPGEGPLERGLPQRWH